MKYICKLPNDFGQSNNLKLKPLIVFKLRIWIINYFIYTNLYFTPKVLECKYKYYSNVFRILLEYFSTLNCTGIVKLRSY